MELRSSKNELETGGGTPKESQKAVTAEKSADEGIAGQKAIFQ